MELDQIAEEVRAVLEAKNRARDAAIERSRMLTRHCANAIRAMHRQEWDKAQELLNTARDAMRQTLQGVAAYPDLYYAGYLQDAIKEFVEAATIFALVRGEALPGPKALDVEEATYLNGLAEAASELRRYILDILRDDRTDDVERLLARMEAIYDTLVTFDLPDAVSGGLRHRTDNLRGVLERTRGDVTLSLRQQRLQAAMDRAEARSGPRRLDAPPDGSV